MREGPGFLGPLPLRPKAAVDLPNHTGRAIPR